MRRLLTRLSTMLLCLGMVAPAAAQAPQYPSRPIRIIVNFSPGGTADALARIVAREMAGSLSQGVVVENRSGASGLIGTEYMAKAAVGGYTLGVNSVSQIALPFASRAIGYDPRFVRPVTLIATVPGLLSAHPSLPARTPDAIIGILHSHVARALSKPEVRTALYTLGAEPSGMSPEAFATFVEQETDKIGTLVTHLNIRLD